MPGRYVKAGDALAHERLEQYRRHAHLVAEQEAALEADDLDRFEALGERIERLQREIGPTQVAAGFAPDDEAFAREATEILEATLARSARLKSRLQALRDESAEDIRDHRERRPMARRYVAEGGSTRSTRLDVKL